MRLPSPTAPATPAPIPIATGAPHTVPSAQACRPPRRTSPTGPAAAGTGKARNLGEGSGAVEPGECVRRRNHVHARRVEVRRFRARREGGDLQPLRASPGAEHVEHGLVRVHGGDAPAQPGHGHSRPPGSASAVQYGRMRAPRPPAAHPIEQRRRVPLNMTPDRRPSDPVHPDVGEPATPLRSIPRSLADGRGNEHTRRGR